MYIRKTLDTQAAERARIRWNSIAKPLFGLGEFENIIVSIAAVQGTEKVNIQKRALAVICADNGVVDEGVTQTGKEVTKIVAENFAKGDTSVCKMAEKTGFDVFAYDAGVIGGAEGTINVRIADGTKNIANGPAMERSDALKAIDNGIKIVEKLKSSGYRIIATGEMGIGNTTTSSAVASVLLGRAPVEVTGRGAGLSSDGLAKKIDVIDHAININHPDRTDAIDVMSKVGGFDICTLAGIFIGGAVHGVNVIIDGFISATAALCADKILPGSADFMIASHSSKETAMEYVLDALGKKPVIYADMCLGEDTGAVLLGPLLDAVTAVYEGMATFNDIDVEEYKEQCADTYYRRLRQRKIGIGRIYICFCWWKIDIYRYYETVV